MELIKINPFFGPKEEVLTQASYLLPFGDGYAVTTDGFTISIVEVVPDPERVGEFKPKVAFSHIDVAIDDKRTLEGIKEVVQLLRTMTAYDLLTKHYNLEWTTFLVNREKTYAASFEDGEMENDSDT